MANTTTPAYVKSDNIRVFPCANRNVTRSRNARLTTEYNLISIINKLVDQVSFVVSYEHEGVTVAESDTMTINVNGYLFTFYVREVLDAIAAQSITFQVNDKIYANINMQKYGDEKTHLYLSSFELIDVRYTSAEPVPTTQLLDVTDSTDEDSDFVGLGFTLNQPYQQTGSATSYKSLQILTITDVDGDNVKAEVPQDSRLKFETNKDGTHRSLKIDDGVL